ncbi:MAG TPA: VOC family protein [Candidatus Paceibacterota bacterium]|nr:VOC family protein [Candidatus Paceibacterota bacterium]
MQKIIPHLWFDTQAKEAAEFYVSLFPDSRITDSRVLHDTPSGDAETVTFDLSGYSFMAISAGPYFKMNPAISFMLNFDPSKDERAEERLRALWEKLSEGGKALMPLDTYPFSPLFGWIADKYGVTWQLMLTNPEGEERPFIIPSLLFVGDVCGKAEEAGDFYISVFKDAKRGTLVRYPAGREPDKEGTVMFSDFELAGQWFTAMDSAYQHEFGFTEAISLMVRCNSQEEIDYYTEKLSAHPESEQCGWVKDQYGVSWQITPTRMDEMMREGTPEQIGRVTQAFLKMKKFDLAKLEQAYAGTD